MLQMNVWNPNLIQISNRKQDVFHNLNVIGSTIQYNPLYLVGSNGQGLKPDKESGNMFFMGDASGIGINIMNPTATLDIYGERSETLNLSSNQTVSRNT